MGRIDEFAQCAAENLHMTTKYWVDVKPAGDIAGTLTVAAESLSFPGRGLMTQERKLGTKHPFDLPLQRTFSGDMEITFLFDKGGGARQMVEDWMDLVVDDLGQINPNRSDYLGQIIVYLLDNSGEIKWAAEVNEVYPKTIHPLALSWSDNNNYIRQTVSFSFRDYTIDTSESLPANIPY